MVWQPTSSGTSQQQDGIRVGTVRPSMQANTLLSKAELGQPKKCQFNSPSPDHVFGYTAPKDPEGAREVTMLWKEHKPSSHAKPVPDFKTMNKLAADSGLTTAKEQPTFRSSNQVTIRPFEATAGKKSPSLPSEKNSNFTYGIPSAHRSAEVVRTHGPEEPPVKYLVQGAYQEEWLHMNIEKDAVTQRERPYIPPVPTKAALGHSLGASKYMQQQGGEEPWKMPKFKNVGPKVTQYM